MNSTETQEKIMSHLSDIAWSVDMENNDLMKTLTKIKKEGFDKDLIKSFGMTSDEVKQTLNEDKKFAKVCKEAYTHMVDNWEY